MLNQSLLQVTPQVKPQAMTRQALLVQAITQAVTSMNAKAEIKVDGQKFSFEFKQGAGGNKNHYVIKTSYRPVVKEQALTVRRTYATIDSFIKSNAAYSIRYVVSSPILEVDYGMSSMMSSKITAVANVAEVVESFVAKVCGELGWPYTKPNPRKAAFNERVNMLRGEIEQGIN